MPRHVFTLIMVLGLCGLAHALYVRHRAMAVRPNDGTQFRPRAADVSPRGQDRDTPAPLANRAGRSVRAVQAGNMPDEPRADRAGSANPPPRFDGLALRPARPAGPASRPQAVVWPPTRDTSAAPPTIAAADESPAARAPGVPRRAAASAGEWLPASAPAPASAGPLDRDGPLLVPPANLPPGRQTAVGRVTTGSLCGSWQDPTRRIQLDSYGRIVVEEDGLAANPAGGPATGPTEHRVLTGWYHVDEQALQVSWDDGPRTTYRWQLRDGRLWLTSSDDCHFILSKAHPTTVQR